MKSICYTKHIPSLVPAVATLILASGLKASAETFDATLDADAHVRAGGFNNYNYGATNTAYLTESSSQRAWARFSLPLVDLNDVVDATFSFSLRGTVTSQTMEVYGLRDDGVSGTAEQWIEGTYTGTDVTTDGDPATDNWITSNNAPANGFNIVTDSQENVYATLLGTVSVSGVSGDQFSLTNTVSGGALLNFLQADTTGDVTFILRTSSGGTIAVAMRERTDTPEMGLTLSTIPEPGTYALLLGLGAFGLIGLRRRVQR